MYVEQTVMRVVKVAIDLSERFNTDGTTYDSYSVKATTEDGGTVVLQMYSPDGVKINDKTESEAKV